ncbi:DUF488 domain-containing protein [Cellulosimicrobium protaetiae]|uniref:DUF488 domain-containing protein n=1 Tax=Cellulosimicrobium protaetiae TaxID=2587808 RepID=A0A6M5UND5_9MICO|nr:DUF488 domain-containing protein [Cellulosimicrobium protaetiae]
MRIKRVYEPADEGDGFRVLVDRLWPRGETKEKARVDLWLKEVAPSTELRRWFHHEERLFDDFAERYRAELDANGEAVGELRAVVGRHPVVTLLFGAKDEQHNQAVVLRDYLAATASS